MDCEVWRELLKIIKCKLVRGFPCKPHNYLVTWVYGGGGMHWWAEVGSDELHAMTCMRIIIVIIQLSWYYNTYMWQQNVNGRDEIKKNKKISSNKNKED